MAEGNRKRVLALMLAGVLAAGISGCSKSAGAGEISAKGYSEEQVKLRDITTYHSFTGNIAPVTEKNVLPDLTGVKVTRVNVEKGDEVHAGDVLMTLDEDSLNEQIAELQASINAADTSVSISVTSAQQAYNNYQQNLNDGLDANITNAKNSMDSACAALVSAQQNYNNEVNLNNQQLSQTILSAKQSVDSTYSSLQSAQSQLEQAQLSVDHARENRQKAADKGIGEDDLYQYDQQIASAEQQVNSAQTAVDNAERLYNDAVNGYEAAKIGEENNLTALYDALIQAQTAYVNSVDAYNTAVRGSEQQLQSYATQVQTAKTGSTQQDANRLKLQDLQNQLGDCNVKSPIDGVITQLNVKEGDIAATTQPAAVVTSFDKMKIDIKINEYDILGVEEGKPVTINIDALDKDYQGTIKNISRVATIENGVSYFESEVDFDGDEDARSGMSAEVRLVTSEADNTTSISAEAIQTAEDGSTFVYMYADDKKKTLKEQPVTLGISDGTFTQITEGLYPGDTILYKPSMNLDMMYGMQVPAE